MELAIEMIIRASQEGLEVREIPIELHPRGGRSKLEPLRDGWRALHLMLGYSPNHLFMLPGVVLTLVGTFMVCTVTRRRQPVRSALVHPRPDRRGGPR